MKIKILWLIERVMERLRKFAIDHFCKFPDLHNEFNNPWIYNVVDYWYIKAHYWHRDAVFKEFGWSTDGS